MGSARISVALCTFNGEPYIAELLQSIVRQQRLPDELVVGDDSSTDGTPAVLKEFAGSAPFAVNIRTAHSRRGVVENFSETMGACKGDVIVLCDQDDLWMPTKLVAIEREFASRRLAAAFSDADLMGPTGTSLGRTLWEELGFKATEQELMRRGRGLEVLLKRNVVTGTTLAVSADVASIALPLPPEGLHDVWLGWVAASLGPIQPIAEPLVRYRQHSSNLVGAPRRGLRDRLRHRATLGDVSAGEAAHLGALLERLAFHASLAGHSQVAMVQDKIAHLLIRSTLPSSRWARIGPILREVRRHRYGKFGRGWESVVFDLLFRS